MSERCPVGDGGESSAPAGDPDLRCATHIGPGEGIKSLWVMGELVTYKISGEQTGGAYSLFEVTSGPGSGPPPHVQHREDEVFWVIEGQYEFLVEDRTIAAGADSLVYVPRGYLHAHKNVGEGPGRLLVSVTPGGPHERFFEEIGEPASHDAPGRGPEELPDMGRIAQIAAEYGIEIPPPPRRKGEHGVGAI